MVKDAMLSKLFSKKNVVPRYLDPTIDLVFKKLFGDKSNKDVTIDFLNTILELKPGNFITTVEFNDPFNRKRNKQDKLSVVDVRCSDQAGKTYIVEMQADLVSDFKQRCEYYVAKEFSSQLNKKDFYGAATPVMLVAVLDFTLFDEHERYLSHHAVTDLVDGKVYLNSMKFHFIELKKFNKTESQLSNMIDRWVFFFKHAKDYRDNPEKIARGNKAISTAFEIVNQSNWTKKELAMYDRRLDALRLQRARMADAKQKGIEEGLAKGEKRGEKKGEQKAALSIAQNLLAQGVDEKIVINATKLPIDAIKKLKSKEKKG